MDIFANNTMEIITTLFKVVFVFAGLIISLISLFQIKEANKMERIMRIDLPAGVHLSMALQLILSVVFVFALTIYLFFLGELELVFKSL